VSDPVDFNEARRKRAMSERRWNLGPYQFRRRATVPPEVLMSYSQAGRDGDDLGVIERFEKALLDLTEPNCMETRPDGTTILVPTAEAWKHMREVGDENDVVSFDDLTAITKYLVDGAVERPTGAPSDSQDGLPTPATGTTSMDGSPSEGMISILSTPGEHATPPTPT
jgi:hypothetical protein